MSAAPDIFRLPAQGRPLAPSPGPVAGRLHRITHGKPRGNRYCGPGALSTVAGITTREAAARIRGKTGKRKVQGTPASAMLAVLDDLGYRTFKVRTPTGTMKRLYPTLTEWLASTERKDRMFLVIAGHHWQVIRGDWYCCGQCKNGEPVKINDAQVKLRARVADVWLIEERDELKWR